MKHVLEHAKITSLTRRLDFDKAHGAIRVRDDFVQIRVNPAANHLKDKQSCEFREVRLGIVVSKKFGNSVERNRFKRIVRFALREVIENVDFSGDIIVLPRNMAKNAKSTDIVNSLYGLFERAKRKFRMITSIDGQKDSN